MNFLPKARENEIVVQESYKEVLIYDLQRHKALSLNETAAFVWKNCDGKTTFAELQKLSGERFTDGLILLTLHRLQAENLLQEQIEILPDKISRRQMVTKYGGLAVSLPLITTLIAPTSANAQSLTGMDCGIPTPLPAGCNFGTSANDCPTCIIVLQQSNPFACINGTSSINPVCTPNSTPGLVDCTATCT